MKFILSEGGLKFILSEGGLKFILSEGGFILRVLFTQKARPIIYGRIRRVYG